MFFEFFNIKRQLDTSTPDMLCTHMLELTLIFRSKRLVLTFRKRLTIIK